MSPPSARRPIGREQCSRCGQQHPRTCSGHVDAPDGTLRPCRKDACHGQRVCEKHGGASPQAKAAAARRMAEAEAGKALDRLGPLEAVPIRDTLGRLAQLAGQMDRWMTVTAQRVAELRELGDAEGRVRPEVAVFERAMGRLGQLLVAIGRLDLDERISRLDRAQAQAMAGLFDRAMVRSGMSPAQQTLLRAAFADEVRALPREDTT